jgi:BirA family transcriptional regulator, biotin operon repressor / biotin---[acetyl-CoA-carboxylase] ligase
LRSSRSETALPLEFDDAFERARTRLAPLARRVLYFTTTESTNDVAASLAAEPESFGTVVMADAQTAGRGRRGHTWFSPAGSGLYVSVILAPSRAADPDRATTLLTLAAGVAIAEGVERATGLTPAIKWPNDLLVSGRKLAGILAEAFGGAVVLGYGVNLGPAAYPRELRDRATCLETELGRPIDRAAVAVETLAALASRYDDLVSGRFDAILDAWRRRAPTHRGAQVVWDTPAGPQSGVTDGIDDTGALLVRVADRVERIVAGEVRWL